MRENLIKLDIFDVLAVISYEAKHEVGKHGRAIIRAIIEERREEEYINTAKNTRWVRVNAIDETDKESTIFYGLLEKICFFRESGSFIVELDKRNILRKDDFYVAAKVALEIDKRRRQD